MTSIVTSTTDNQTFVPDEDNPTGDQALSWDGHRLDDLPQLTAALMDALVDAQDLAERTRAPMPTLAGWLLQPDPADVPIDLWPVAA